MTSLGAHVPEVVHIVEAMDIVRARAEARRLASEIGFSSADQTRLATAVSELSRNILQYAGKGECTMHDTSDAGSYSIRIVFEDRGPGISDIASAMLDGYSTSRGLGAGLPGTKRLMDEFSIASEPGYTRVEITMKRQRS